MHTKTDLPAGKEIGKVPWVTSVTAHLGSDATNKGSEEQLRKVGVGGAHHPVGKKQVLPWAGEHVTSGAIVLDSEK